MSNMSQVCQKVYPSAFSRLLQPRWVYKFFRLILYVRRDGIRSAVRRGAAAIRRELGRTAAARAGAARRRAVARAGEVLELQPGEWVEVKPYEEILATLDSKAQHRGLTFLAEMQSFCGGTFQVYKRMQRLFLEESQQVRTLKNTVLLSGVVCSGAGYGGCDRSCLYYWREVWLRRAPGAAAGERRTSGLTQFEPGQNGA